MPPAYNRAIKMFDEAHSPETLDQFVASGNINTGKFLSEAHAQSYLLQMHIIARRKDVHSVFELGPGEHYCARNLRALGLEYVTFDFDNTYHPNIVGEWNTYQPRTLGRRFDAACAFQVLEHFPWERFHLNLLKLSMLSHKYVFISLPYSCTGIMVQTTVHAGQGKTTTHRQEHFVPTGLPQRKYRPEYVEEFPWAVHYWEIGRQGVMLQDVEAVIAQCNLTVLEQFHAPNPYHYFMLLQKRET